MRNVLFPLSVLFLLNQAFAASCSNTSLGNGIVCVQSASVATAASSGTLAFGSNNTAGNLAIVAIRCVTSTGPATPTDSRNTYTAVGTQVQIDSVASQFTNIFYSANIGAGANTVSFSCPSATRFKAAIFEYSGLATVTPLDKTTGQGASSTTMTSGATATTMQAIELVFAVGAYGSTDAAGAGAGFSLRENQSVTGDVLETEDEVLTSTGTPNATWAALTTGTSWGSIIATFKKAAATCGHTLSLLGAGCS
jgi:hypothetical protein